MFEEFVVLTLLMYVLHAAVSFSGFMSRTNKL